MFINLSDGRGSKVVRLIFRTVLLIVIIPIFGVAQEIDPYKVAAAQAPTPGARDNARVVTPNGRITTVFARYGDPQPDTFAPLDAQHSAVLSAWLRTTPRFRLATEADCKNKSGLAATRAEYGASYHPYYAVGDFNSDHKEDFAVALIDRNKRTKKFAIAIFNGPFSNRGGTPAFLLPDTDLSDGGLIKRSGSPLIAGVFQSDDCVLLQPRGRTYAVRSCS